MPRLPYPRFAPDASITFDGRAVPARTGESVAAALLAAGRAVLARSSKYHRARGPFCLSGTCGNCFVRVDGEPSRRACRTPCRDGLAVESQNAWPSAEHDVLGVIDRVFTRGLDHHHLMTSSRLANRAALATARRLAGVGRLPTSAPEPWPAPGEERFDALVVGGGPAGLGAAEVLSAGGLRVLLADDARAPGGRLRCRFNLEGDPPLSWADQVAELVVHAGGEVAPFSPVIGLWRDGGAPLAGVLSHAAPAPRLRLVRAPRIVLCPGAYAQPPVFENNDLPGVFSGRGVAAALADDGLVPGACAVLSGNGPETQATAKLLAWAGMRVELTGGDVTRVDGGHRVTTVSVEGGLRVSCDSVIITSRPVPATELARLLGAALAFDAASGAWSVQADGHGATGVPGLWAAGECVAALSASDAAEAGRRAGESALRA